MNDSPDRPAAPHDQPEDEALLDQLRAAIEEHDPVPPDLLAGAKAAIDARNLDDELAALLFDSAVEPVGVRGVTTFPRQLSFQIDAGSVEVEIADGRIVGQIVPPSAGIVSLVAPAGPAVTTNADETGHFVFASPPNGVVRLRATVAGRPTITDWFAVSPR